MSPGLYRLEVSRNPLHSVPDEAFIGLERSLWELELTHGYLTSVPSRAFRHLQKLRVLNLRGILHNFSQFGPCLGRLYPKCGTSCLLFRKQNLVKQYNLQRFQLG